jgi:hypothetical protein
MSWIIARYLQGYALDRIQVRILLQEYSQLTQVGLLCILMAEK